MVKNPSGVHVYKVRMTGWSCPIFRSHVLTIGHHRPHWAHLAKHRSHVSGYDHVHVGHPASKVMGDLTTWPSDQRNFFLVWELSLLTLMVQKDICESSWHYIVTLITKPIDLYTKHVDVVSRCGLRWFECIVPNWSNVYKSNRTIILKM